MKLNSHAPTPSEMDVFCCPYSCEPDQDHDAAFLRAIEIPAKYGRLRGSQLSAFSRRLARYESGGALFGNRKK